MWVSKKDTLFISWLFRKSPPFKLPYINLTFAPLGLFGISRQKGLPTKTQRRFIAHSQGRGHGLLMKLGPTLTMQRGLGSLKTKIISAIQRSGGVLLAWRGALARRLLVIWAQARQGIRTREGHSHRPSKSYRETHNAEAEISTRVDFDQRNHLQIW